MEGEGKDLEHVIPARDPQWPGPLLSQLSVGSEALLHDLDLNGENFFKHHVAVNSGQTRTGHAVK